MKIFRRAIGLLALAGFVTQAAAAGANAADIYKDARAAGLKDVPITAPYPSFAGFYIGGNVGYAWADVYVIDKDRYNGSGGWAYEAGAFQGGVQLGTIGNAAQYCSASSGNWVTWISSDWMTTAPIRLRPAAIPSHQSMAASTGR